MPNCHLVAAMGFPEQECPSHCPLNDLMTTVSADSLLKIITAPLIYPESDIRRNTTLVIQIPQHFSRECKLCQPLERY